MYASCSGAKLTDVGMIGIRDRIGYISAPCMLVYIWHHMRNRSIPIGEKLPVNMHVELLLYI